MNTLYIDTSSNTEIIVGIDKDGKRDVKTKTVDKRKAQVVLPLIQELLKSHSLTSSDLDAIEVNQGPGSFTGIRVGITIANTLSKELQIPINGKNPGTIIEAVYS